MKNDNERQVMTFNGSRSTNNDEILCFLFMDLSDELFRVNDWYTSLQIIHQAVEPLRLAIMKSGDGVLP